MVKTGAFVLLLLLGITSTASAQIVRGIVVEAESSAPLSGVFVVLVDTGGRARGGVLTDAKGSYAIAASVAGTYRVRAERIGHASTVSAPFTLQNDMTETVNVRVPLAPIELAAIDVATDSRCIRRPTTGLRTAQLWEEARKALSVAQWTERHRGYQFEMRSYVRDVDAKTLLVRNETQRYGISNSRPYAAVSVDTLARYGFVRNEGSGMVYYGPDAEVLLSDEFLDRHCFHSVMGDGANAGMIGLVFQPATSVKLPDVKGTLWLDARTYELKHIEFTYDNLSREYRVRGTGGRTEFQRLGNGAWIVSRWYIRMPTVVGGRLQGFEAVMLQEEGGEVVSIRDPQSPGANHVARDGAVEGAIYDSIAGAPLARANVYLSGTVHRTTTDDAGRFRLANIPPGNYLIAFAHPALDSLPALPAPRAVEVSALDTAAVRLAIPTRSKLIAAVCPNIGAADREKTGVLFGTVRDDRGNAIANAGVRATTLGRNDTTAPLAATTETDAAGQYILCGIPREVLMDVRALVANRGAMAQQVRITHAPYRRVDLRVAN